MKRSFIVLFGSGELAHVGTQTHTKVAQWVGMHNPRVVILTTAVGFQPNKIALAQETAEHMKKALYNFHPVIQIIDAPTRQEANHERVVRDVLRADYLYFSGGSPTYLIHHLKDTLLSRYMTEAVNDHGASLSLASASVLAFSRWCLPVYEIFKVGEDPHWEDGLNLSALFGLPYTYSFIPHLNNNEGGTKLDTSYCYMGKSVSESFFLYFPPCNPTSLSMALMSILVWSSSGQTG